MATNDPFSKSTLFQQALLGILRPLIRALIAQGVTAPAFYRIVKRSYVHVAEQEMGDGATDSAISVATGVHRRDVKTFRQPADPTQENERRGFSILATVVGRWLSDPSLTDANGDPLSLPRTGEVSFDELVRSVSMDIRPRAVLDELVRQRIATEEDDMLALDADTLVGPANLDQKLHFFSLNLGDHMNAAVENLLHEDPPFLERAVFYNNLTEASSVEIEAESRRVAVEALMGINALARARQAADRDDPDATHRFRFGVFYYAEDEGHAGPQEDDDQEGS